MCKCRVTWLKAVCAWLQVEMTGSSVFDYVHHQDHAEVAEQLGLGLAQGQNLSSPNSAGSEEGVNSSTGTNNPDGESMF
jgi:hypothetical protein